MPLHTMDDAVKPGEGHEIDLLCSCKHGVQVMQNTVENINEVADWAYCSY